MNIHFSMDFNAQNTHFSIEKQCVKYTFQILPLILPLQKALELRVVAQKRVHQKPCAEAEAGDEGLLAMHICFVFQIRQQYRGRRVAASTLREIYVKG